MTKKKPDKNVKITHDKKKNKLPEGLVPSGSETENNNNRDAGFPIVGLGASAGGLAAFEAFFSRLPAVTVPGMAFVIVQHLAPDYKSILADLIRRYTSIDVFEVEDGMEVKPNCAYIIPPNRDMAFMNGTLQLLEPSAPKGQRHAIDFFFRSLARDQHERAIGIILSGTGSDGTLGIRAIKGEGGMVMVQKPSTAEFDGMPRSAISTGLVDFELSPADMPAQLITYVTHALGVPLKSAVFHETVSGNALKKIFILLRAQTGHDFSMYKPSTVNRRIERRMAVRQIETMENYVKYLQQLPSEVDALFSDILIGVTAFFRDPEAFSALEELVIPGLFTGKTVNDVIRIWVPGCSTGEEAYSIAILLAEYQDKIKQVFKVQIFATDIDSRAIAVARAGVYPVSIGVDITQERLGRYFNVEPGGSSYSVHKSIRDMLVFSEQDVIKDPPFSKLDLISCRNLLIYMGEDLQKKVIQLFHYALNKGGYLFLGTSETAGDSGEIFNVLDRKLKIYHNKGDFHYPRRTGLGRFLPPMTALDEFVPKTVKKSPVPVKQSLRELTEQALLQHIAAAAVLVNRFGDIHYLHGRAGLYLEPAQGEAGVNNILKMAREGLRHELVMALQKAAAGKVIVRCPGLRVKTNGDFTTVNLTIRHTASEPSSAAGELLFLVVLEEAVTAGTGCKEKTGIQNIPEHPGNDGDTDERIAALKLELRNKEEYLQTTIEELEVSNEELRSSNEELQSVTEEFQSITEELETSKEELQSVNEELSTVNAELQVKLTDLSRANNDMNNLLAGTGIATVFVNLNLQIQHFTPAASRIINLIFSDVGRPIGHISSNLEGYNRFVEDIQDVLNTLIHKEIEVRSQADVWYLMRILPYRTLENVIEGAVITFLDITDRKLAEESLLHKNKDIHRLAVIINDSYDAIIMQDLDGSIMAWNPGAQKIYGYSEQEAMSMNIIQIVPESRRYEELSIVRKLSRSVIIEPYHSTRIAKNGRLVDIWITATALIDKNGKMYAVATTEKEITKTV